MPSCTSMTPSSKWLDWVKPAWVNTPSILRFWGSTDAVNPEIPALAGRRRQVLEQDRGHAATVVVVVDEERHLGIAAAPVAVVAGHAHQLVADEADERHAVGVVDVGEALEVASREAWPRREVAEVDALGRLALVEAHDALGVVGADGPHGHGAAVGQHDLRFPPAGVVGHGEEATGGRAARTPAVATHRIHAPPGSTDRLHPKVRSTWKPAPER
jgi:hypothetical protein